MKPTDEIQRIVKSGKPTVITLDPNLKDTINRSQLDTMIREAKKHLAMKKKVQLVMVKE